LPETKMNQRKKVGGKKGEINSPMGAILIEI
jgi:hypothetical protein